MEYRENSVVVIDLGTLDESNLESFDTLTCPSDVKQLRQNRVDLFQIYQVISNGRYLGAIYKVDGEDSRISKCRYTFMIDGSNIVGVAPDGEYEYLYQDGYDRSLIRGKGLLEDGCLVSIYREGEGWIKPNFDIEHDLICVFSSNRRIVPTKSAKIDIKSGSFELEESLFY